MMNSIYIEFRSLVISVVLYMLGGSTSAFIGNMNFFLETAISLRTSSSYRNTVSMAVFIFGIENIMDAELMMAIDLIVFLFNLITLILSVGLTVLTLGALIEGINIEMKRSFHSFTLIEGSAEERSYHIDGPLFICVYK